ncbi:hypothetical protein AVEN_253618-1 [Araneus ventricosus]|uniref:Uncharacterized protein n=1 Tax=Araneus ventricosus TaxID=182803 RepID=A0A4Y2CAJ2_ARAVE|nr:hypothetical protein AVEN_253618-1 [Araneus ventricosus]
MAARLWWPGGNIEGPESSKFETSFLQISAVCVGLMHVKSDVKCSFTGRGANVERWMPAQVTSSSVDCGSKLRGPS